ncbi:hypothetical protein HI914_01981 [Erysiphe necator]|nr:hypothetical protein HI914_01981 [Erysiphe necator]
MQFNVFALFAFIVSVVMATETVTVTVCAPSATYVPSQGYAAPTAPAYAPIASGSPAVNMPGAPSGGYAPPAQSPVPFTGSASSHGVSSLSALIVAGIVALAM